MKKDRINEIVSEEINKVIKESLNKSPEPLLEMARINTNENGKCIFPYNSFEVKMWSKDHEPPHFHVISDGWNISFLVEDGELYKVESRGSNVQVYNYICANVKEWLSSKCAIIPDITNQKNALAVWAQIHD